MEENKNLTQQAAAPADKAPEEKPAPLDNRQKTALLRYLTVLFAVAFLLVLVSLVIQSHNSKTTLSEITQNSSDALTSAMANAEALQDQNRQLQDENAVLRAQISALEAVIDEKEQAVAELETLLAVAADHEDAANQAAADLAALRQTYDALLTAMTCTTQEGNVTFSRAMDTVEKNQGLLSESALRVYESLLNADAEE